MFSSQWSTLKSTIPCSNLQSVLSEKKQNPIISETMSKTIFALEKKLLLSPSAETTHEWLGRIGAWQQCRWQEQVSVTILQTSSFQTSVVPWARVMASLRWAVQCYCRITERLIETNGSNNGTLSPQAGFLVGLISITAVARRTSCHADPSKETAKVSFKVGSMGFSYLQHVRLLDFCKICG